jgi:hypothetical protein
MLETDYTGRSSATNSDVLAAERRRPPAPLDENQRRWRLIAKQPASGPKQADLTRLWIVIPEAGVTVRWRRQSIALSTSASCSRIQASAKKEDPLRQGLCRHGFYICEISYCSVNHNITKKSRSDIQIGNSKTKEKKERKGRK